MGMELTLTCGCGYRLPFSLGIGMGYPYQCQSILEAMCAGEYGPQVQSFAKATPHPGIFTDLKLYRCGQCGELKNEAALSLCTPIGPYRKRTVPFCAGMGLDEEFPYVMEHDLGESYREVISRKHPCRCGCEMEPAADLNSLPCPRCGARLRKQTDMMWD